MKNNRIISMLLAIAVCANMGALHVFAQGSIAISEPETAYLDYLDNPDNYAIIPPSATVQASTKEKNLFRTEQALPSKYDLRDVTGLPPVRNQGADGICWTFSSSAALESNLLLQGRGNEFLKDEGLLFSEKHMGMQCSVDNGNPWGFNRTADGGGNNYYAQAYYSRGDGPVFEKDYVEGQPNIVSPADEYYTKPAEEVKKVAGDVVFVPDMPRNMIGGVTSADRQTFISDMKETILTYGAVSTSFYSNMGSLVTNDYMNRDTNAYYYYGEYRANNHAVAVVGWDDAYPKENFLKQPEGDGAWLIRNSWGADQFDGGYMWISYYDVCFGTYSAAFASLQEDDGYEHIYQYDPFGYAAWTYLHYGDNTPVTSQWATNLFPIRDTSEDVTSIGVFVCQPNTTCDISVNVFADKDALFAHHMTDADVIVSKTFEKPGYYQITLPRAVSLESGGLFAASVRYTVSGEDYVYLPVECNYREEGDGMRQNATAAPGQSFLYWDDSNSWQDVWNNKIEDVADQINFNIKAYTQHRVGYGEMEITTDEIKTEAVEGGNIVTIPVSKSIREGIYGAKLLMVPIFENGEMGKAEMASVTMEGADEKTEVSFMLKGADSAKLFLWDGFDSMRPLNEQTDI